MRRPRSPPPPPSSSSSSSFASAPLKRISTVIHVLRHVRISTIADILKLAHVSDTFREALESYSARIWRSLASSIEDSDSSPLIACFKHSAVAWTAEILLIVGQLDGTVVEVHALFVGADSGAVDVVHVCLAAMPDCVDVRDGVGNTALHSASVECAQALLAAGADITIVDRLGFTALHSPAAEGYDDVVRVLAAHADFAKIFDMRDRDGWTAMDIAETDEIKQLLSDSK